MRIRENLILIEYRLFVIIFVFDFLILFGSLNNIMRYINLDIFFLCEENEYFLLDCINKRKYIGYE